MAAKDQSWLAARLTGVLVADPGDLPIRACGSAFTMTLGLFSGTSWFAVVVSCS